MLTPHHQPLLDWSGTIAAGGTAQNLFEANDSPRFYFLFQNTSDTEMRLDWGSKLATADKSILIAAGAAWEPPAGVMFHGPASVFCATTGKTFVCKTA